MKIEIEVFVCKDQCWVDYDNNQRDMFQAQIKDDPNFWGCGDSTESAIGKLISTYPEQFNIDITFSDPK